jgi:hypothetical protein
VRRTLSVADIIELERAQVAAGSAPCGKVCDDGCHGDLVCLRVAHPHDPDAEMPPHPVTGIAQANGNVTPHYGYDGAGEPIQWQCLPGDHDGLTADQRAAKWGADAAAAKKAATEALLASIDPELLVQLLREGGHL